MIMNLTVDYAKQYIKSRLGVPYVPFELDDNQLLFWIEYSLREFSQHIPRKETVVLDIENTPGVKTEEKNVFRIPVSDPVISVLNVYAELGNRLLAGHPLSLFPIPNLEYQIGYYSGADMANTAFRNSQQNFTFEFISPDKIRITPSFAEKYILEVELMHKLDLSTIKPEWSNLFLMILTKNVARVLATIRMTYRSYDTPVGTIEVNGEMLETLADRLEEQIREITSSILPGVIIHIA